MSVSGTFLKESGLHFQAFRLNTKCKTMIEVTDSFLCPWTGGQIFSPQMNANKKIKNLKPSSANNAKHAKY